MKNLLVLAAIVAVSFAAVAVDLDRDGIADVVLPDTAFTPIIEPAISVNQPWAVREGWRGGYDWNGDGIIDWRDDFLVSGVKPWEGTYVRGDWNRDGVIDARDGWRRFDSSWANGSWDPTWRGEGWRPETVSVREVPAGSYQDGDWKTVEGPWESFGWGGSLVGDWNRDGVIDFRDDLAWRSGFRGGVVQGAPAYTGSRVVQGSPNFAGSRVVGGNPFVGGCVVGAPVVSGTPVVGERIYGGSNLVGGSVVGAPVVGGTVKTS